MARKVPTTSMRSAKLLFFKSTLQESRWFYGHKSRMARKGITLPNPDVVVEKEVLAHVGMSHLLNPQMIVVE